MASTIAQNRVYLTWNISLTFELSRIFFFAILFLNKAVYFFYFFSTTFQAIKAFLRIYFRYVCRLLKTLGIIGNVSVRLCLGKSARKHPCHGNEPFCSCHTPGCEVQPIQHNPTVQLPIYVRGRNCFFQKSL